MEILKGQVKFLGRDDYEVNYSVVGEKQYYITKELSNGNYIVTTVLRDAILKDAISNGAFKDEGVEENGNS